KPVAEARVSFAGERRRAAAATDAAGRFRLPDVADGPGFLFVEKTGFRFHGQPARAGGALEVVLVRRAEPSGKELTTLPAVLGKKERHALAARALQPVVKDITKLNESNRTWALEALAVLDPGRVLELLDKGVEKHPWFQDYLRRAVVKALLVDSPDEARTV